MSDLGEGIEEGPSGGPEKYEKQLSGTTGEKRAMTRGEDRSSEQDRAEAARAAATALHVAVRWARWPLLVLLLVPLPALAALLVLAPLIGGRSGLVIGVLAALGTGVVAVFGRRRHQYRVAAADREALEAEFFALTEPGLIADEALVQMRLAATGRRLFLLRRLKAIRALTNFPDHLQDKIGGYGYARWFLPPTVGASWGILVMHLWVWALSWPVLFLVITLWSAGTIGR